MLGIGLGAGYVLPSLQQSGAPTKEEAQVPIYYRNPMNPVATSPTPMKDAMGMDYVPVYAEIDKTEATEEVLFYRNPMNPDVTSSTPMKDSMGMDYVPVYAETGRGDDVVGTVSIDPVVVQNIGVRTAFAEKTSLARAVRAVGRVVFDEERITRLHPKVEGWIENIRADKTGQTVRNNEILLNIYSPKLVSAQQEYLLALNNLKVLE